MRLHRPVPHLRARRAGGPLEAHPQLLPAVSFLVLTSRRNSMHSIRTALLALCVAAAAHAQAPAGGEIKVGGIFDLTGMPTYEGKPFAQGVRDGVSWTNDNGGINGKKIRLVDVDYGYKIPEAVAAYKRMVGDEKVIMINGWGTGDTEGLKA